MGTQIRVKREEWGGTYDFEWFDFRTKVFYSRRAEDPIDVYTWRTVLRSRPNFKEPCERSGYPRWFTRLYFEGINGERIPGMLDEFCFEVVAEGLHEALIAAERKTDEYLDRECKKLTELDRG